MEYGKIFNFVYLHIILRPRFFLERSHQMFLQLYLVVVVLKHICFTHGPMSHLRHFTETFLCHTLGLTHATPQLPLRPGRPMFAAADLEPSDVRFTIRWST
jgi:hypothetical protein